MINDLLSKRYDKRKHYDLLSKRYDKRLENVMIKDLLSKRYDKRLVVETL